MSDEAKAERGNWDTDFEEGSGSSENQGKAKYMDLSKAGQYRVRLAGPHVRFRKHFKPFRATVKDSLEAKASDPAWKAGFYPSRRFAINVIDKTGLGEGETGELKILEKGPQVFQNFASYKATFGKDPAGKEGPDFIITVKIPNPSNPLSTEYIVQHADTAPFTEAEKAMIKDNNGLWPLSEIYKATPVEKLQEMWDELPDEKKVAPKRDYKEKSGSSNSSGSSDDATEGEVVTETVEESSDELFGDEDNSAELF